MSSGVRSRFAATALGYFDYILPIKENPNMSASAEKPNGSAATCPSHDIDTTKTNVDIKNPAAGVDMSEVVDELQKHLGGYGRYQMLIFILIGAVITRGGWQLWIPAFQIRDLNHHCSASPGLNLSQSVPGTCQNGICQWEKCEQYVNISRNNDTQTCHNGWTYLMNSTYTSIVSEFNLVCDNTYQKELITTIFMVGSACGLLFLSPLADTLGPKKVMLGCLWVQAVFGTCLIWSGNFIVFCIIKFFIGFTNMTAALCCYVLLAETFDTAHRELPTIAIQFFWALGIMTTALFGYLIPNWEHLQLTIALPINVLSVAYIFIIPEPLPWLLSKGKVNKAEHVINRFIRVNKLPSVPDLKNQLSVFDLENKDNGLKNENKHAHQNSDYKMNENNSIDMQLSVKSVSESGKSEKAGDDSAPVYTLLTLFKTRKMRIYSLLMFYIFMTHSLAYYGTMFSTPDLSGNHFLNLFLLGAVEIPAYILSLVSNKMIGRRRSISMFLFICAAANLSVIFVPDKSGDGADLTKLKAALVIVGKFGISGSYSTIYLYAAEVFPTVVRNQVVGAACFFENIGSIAAPNMVYAKNHLNILPLCIFGGMTILGCGLVLLLPETHNRPLPQTIEDVEHGYYNKKEDEKPEIAIYRKIAVD